jgi:hypothetical protein
MPDTTNVTQLYHELLQLFEAAQQLQAQSAHLLEEACRARAVMPAVSDAPVPLDSHVALSPEQTLDAMIGLLSDFSLETQVAITKALALGMAATTRAYLDVKRPPVA